MNRGRGLARPAIGALLVVALGAGHALAQSPSTQLWGNFTPGRGLGERWYAELDVEPKLQVTSGEEWRNLDLTPAVEFYPVEALDLIAEVTLGRTHQRDGLDTLELTERLGVKGHLFRQLARTLTGERVPLTRFDVATLARIEQRNFHYSDGTPSEHAWRTRVRLEARLALNRRKLSADKVLFASADSEYFAPLGAELSERFVNKFRTRIGVGYRFSARTRVDLLYIRDWNRDAPGEDRHQNVQAFDLRFKTFR